MKAQKVREQKKHKTSTCTRFICLFQRAQPRHLMCKERRMPVYPLAGRTIYSVLVKPYVCGRVARLAVGHQFVMDTAVLTAVNGPVPVYRAQFKPTLEINKWS